MIKVLSVFMSLLIAAPVFGEGNLRIGGGAAPINNIFRKVAAEFTKETGIQLELSEEGPDLALKALDEGRLDIASAGLNPDDWLKLIEQKGIKLKFKNEMTFRLIGKDLIRVVVHPEIAIATLSKVQLKGLFSGQIKNWKEIGGPDQKVSVVYGEKISGTNMFFQRSVMDQQGFVEQKDVTGTAPEILELVSKKPGAIGILPQGLTSSKAAFPKIPEIGRPIYSATRSARSDESLKLFNFILHGAGQKILLAP